VNVRLHALFSIGNLGIMHNGTCFWSHCTIFLRDFKPEFVNIKQFQYEFAESQ
jgi:hypothetical protein